MTATTAQISFIRKLQDDARLTLASDDAMRRLGTQLARDLFLADYPKDSDAWAAMTASERIKVRKEKYLPIATDQVRDHITSLIDTDPEGLSKAEASALIDQLKGIRADRLPGLYPSK